MLMPYRNVTELPSAVQRNLPTHAQDIYRSAFNSAWVQYSDPQKRRGNASRETTAHKVAWAAVERVYEKGSDNKWHRIPA